MRHASSGRIESHILSVLRQLFVSREDCEELYLTEDPGLRRHVFEQQEERNVLGWSQSFESARDDDSQLNQQFAEQYGRQLEHQWKHSGAILVAEVETLEYVTTLKQHNSVEGGERGRKEGTELETSFHRQFHGRDLPD